MLGNRQLNQDSRLNGEALDSVSSGCESETASEAVYSRRGDLVGRAFRIEFLGRSKARWGGFIGGSLNSVVGDLGRVMTLCMLSGNSDAPLGVSPYSHIVLRVSWRLLLVESFSRSLVGVSNKLKRLGYNVSVVLDGGSFLFVREYRELRRIMFFLSDNDVELTLENPLAGPEVPVFDTALMQVFSSVLVTPEWLGIREAEGELDLSQYMSSVSRISSLIHEGGKYVVYGGVSNEWQRSFITSLPVRFYIGSGGIWDEL